MKIGRKNRVKRCRVGLEKKLELWVTRIRVEDT